MAQHGRDDRLSLHRQEAPRVLIADGDVPFATLLAQGLNGCGFAVAMVQTGHAALSHVHHDLVLVDMRLPDIDSQQMCRLLRRRPDRGIIVLSAGATARDRVLSLDAGADDVMTKPIILPEVRARIQAVIRRLRPPIPRVLCVGPLFVDVEARHVSIAGCRLEVTAKEWHIIALLASNAGTAVSRQLLIREVWRGADLSRSRTIDVHICALRRKLGPGLVIETVRNFGYTLRPA